MLSIAIVDDDSKFLKMYSKLVMELFSKKQVHANIKKFSSGVEFMSSIEMKTYDLIFMDIDMPELSGINIAAELRKRIGNLKIIFVSAHPHFVFEAIKVSPYRYIRKNNLLTETSEAIDSYCSELQSNMKMIQLELQNGNNVSEKVNEISTFFTVRHDVFYALNDGKDAKILSRKYNLSILEKQTKPYGFIRVHKSYLVNYKYIASVNSKTILLSNDEEIPISHGKKTAIHDQLMELLRKGG